MARVLKQFPFTSTTLKQDIQIPFLDFITYDSETFHKQYMKTLAIINSGVTALSQTYNLTGIHTGVNFEQLDDEMVFHVTISKKNYKDVCAVLKIKRN